MITNTLGGVPAGVPANRDRLFLASCVALIVTSMTFAFRAGILKNLTAEFTLTDTQLGWVNSMAFLGFPVAMMIGGALYNQIGPRKILWAAFGCHIAGILLTVMAGSAFGPYLDLLISTFLIGLANGSVEAACNPLIAEMYPDKKTEMLNKFHVWFPGGIVIGSLLTIYLEPTLGWRGLTSIMFLPAVIYAVMIFGQTFPRSGAISRDTGKNFASLLNPLFIFIVVCMTLTAASEFATTQWVEKILGASGANPMIILALVTGLMAVGRFFAGPIVHKFNPAGVLWISAILATAGIYLLSTMTGGGVYFAAIVFALGICYFWPTMIGFVGEYLPQTGALGMSLVGGAGMFSLSIWNPIIGGWLDDAANSATAAGLTGAEADIVAGQNVLSTMVWFPLILIVLFGLLYFYMRGRVKPGTHTDGTEIGTPAAAR